jgi:S1-C subfamily serine protease
MNRASSLLVAGLGCAALAMLVFAIVVVVLLIPTNIDLSAGDERAQEQVPEREVQVTPAQLAPTFTPSTERLVEPDTASGEGQGGTPLQPGLLPALYQELVGGVVSIQVVVNRGFFGGGTGAGSGFIIDEEGHVITNYHVVADAQRVTVNFFNGISAEAQVLGADPDSDLAVLQVPDLADGLIEGAHPVPLGDSEDVQVGEWVVAIGNPFGLGGSMTVGIVSALGRTIAAGAPDVPFGIPAAIQTDAAINPGNSGGPLFNLVGQVIGVNAQIATGGGQQSAGVGFAIPSNIVRQVSPVLIEQGDYPWPWLGVTGPQEGVTLLIAQANDLPTQQGAYIHEVVEGGPADEAGLQGSTGTETVDGIGVPVGGDVVIEANGEPIQTFNDLLIQIAYSQPGEVIELTVLRDGEIITVPVELGARSSFEQ